jgi:hypothetical protein
VGPAGKYIDFQFFNIGHPTMAAVNTEHLLINQAAPDHQLKKLIDRVTSLAANAELVMYGRMWTFSLQRRRGCRPRCEGSAVRYDAFQTWISKGTEQLEKLRERRDWIGMMEGQRGPPYRQRSFRGMVTGRNRSQASGPKGTKHPGRPPRSAGYATMPSSGLRRARYSTDNRS